MSKRKRGPYKRYLMDDSEEIPVTTRYSRKKKKIMTQVNSIFLFIFAL